MLPRWKRTIILTHVQLWVPILLRGSFIVIFVLLSRRADLAIGMYYRFIDNLHN
jgi:hypothetical protein